MKNELKIGGLQRGERASEWEKKEELSSSCQVCGEWWCVVVFILCFGNLIFNFDDSRALSNIHEFEHR